jgi:Tfp pilus assembly protein PilV
MRYKGNLVLLELLIALAFFAISAVIGAGVLASAYKISVDSRRTTDALFIAQGWAERIAAAEDPLSPLKAEDPDLGDGCRFEENGYTVEAEISPEPSGAGTLYAISIKVSRSGEALVSLPASRYVPGEVAS